MKITTTQRVIKIGTSAGVTLPAKELKRAGIQPGDDVQISVERAMPVDAHTAEVVAVTQKLLLRHKQALKNLSQR